MTRAPPERRAPALRDSGGMICGRKRQEAGCNSPPSFPSLASVRKRIVVSGTSGEVLYVVPQNIYEFWAVATRPAAANGLGLSVAECQVEVARIKRWFVLLPDMPTLFAGWEVLVETYACHGRVSHDARLVAALRTYGMTRLLTFNGPDFARFPGLTILDPANLPPSTTP